MYCLEQSLSGVDVACGLNDAVRCPARFFLLSSTYDLEDLPILFSVVFGGLFLWLKWSQHKADHPS
jgi:hypothetical protein